MNTAGDLHDFHLDILAQQPRVNRLYTQVTFCFELPESSRPDVIQRLRSGIERLSASFPWVAGVVVRENDTFKIREDQETIPLVVKDLTNALPEWNTLRRADFPFSMLDENVVAPCKTLAAPDEPLSVLLIQANFVTGGLLLTFNGQHGSMDMAGQCHVMSLLAKACRNESFSASELSIGNMNRRNVVQLQPSDELNAEEGRQMAPRNQEEHQTIPTNNHPPNLTWAYFTFSATCLASLKSLATNTIPPGSFASTDDVLSAFVWQRITRVRTQSLGSSSQLTTTLSRNVDMRPYLSMSPTYPGFLTGSTVHTLSAETLVHEPLGKIAVQLRSALDGEALVRKLRMQATRIASRASAASAENPSRPELEIRLSSWAKEACYEYDFGFGLPEAVRRPRFLEGAREGLVYFLPKTLEGKIAVGVCLRVDDLEMLKHDEQFGQYGKYIG